MPQVMEQKFAEPSGSGHLEKPRGQQLVGIDVGNFQRARAGGQADEFFQGWPPSSYVRPGGGARPQDSR